MLDRISRTFVERWKWILKNTGKLAEWEERTEKYLMRLDMRPKGYSERLTSFEHSVTIVLDDGSIKNCSRRWHITQVLSNKSTAQQRFGRTGKEIIHVKSHIPMLQADISPGPFKR